MRSANFFAKTLSRPPRLTKVDVALPFSPQLARSNDYIQRPSSIARVRLRNFGALLDFEQSELAAALKVASGRMEKAELVETLRRYSRQAS